MLLWCLLATSFPDWWYFSGRGAVILSLSLSRFATPVQVTDDVKNELRAFFRPHNEALEKLLGMPLPEAWYS